MLASPATIVAAFAASPDGCTVPTRVGATVPATGYVVADARHGATLPRWDAAAASVWVASNLTSADYLGVWVDSATGTTYLDAVEIHADARHALTRAADQGEIAVWSLADAREIRLSDLA